MATPPVSIFLSPGEYFVGDARHRIRTLLGSCVSITLWAPDKRMGAMSHFLLAQRGSSLIRQPVETSATKALDARYGDEALQLMLNGLAAVGVSPQECQAKLFGGGDMFPSQATLGSPAIGRRNGDAAQALLEKHGIELVSQSLFGTGHRKILFDIATGDVWAHQDELMNEVPPLCASTTTGDSQAKRVIARKRSSTP